ncbi:DUF3011 domain-containing protein [Stenotrophomonas sp. UBA7606]|uniref:DUF3011 domain-containing protein n=1 Tax=Stenotrophomonas sp. UBA7606 TaxID=1947559 RepID=UPI0025FAB244|nr:DUF3011 domain-containing protein [Stenotrophomonas sp. UBA7606]
MYRSILFAGLATLLPLAMTIAPAAAQSYGQQANTIRCESVDQRQRVCRTDWRSAVLVRQLSRGDCVEGRSWGSSNGAVWVSNGCRAEFAEGRGGWGGGHGQGQGGWNNTGTLRCDSNNNRQQVCHTGWRSAVLVRQVSDTRCVEGRNWGSSNGSVWVSGGCRAEFAQGRGNGWGNGNGQGGWNNNGTVRCDSNNNRHQVCNTGWRSAMLLRQISDTRCIEGRNWGSNNGSVWVSGGCRAEFTQGRGGWGGNNNNNNNYFVDCHSNSNRLNTCNWDRRRGHPVIIQQVSDTRCLEGRNWGYNGNSIWVNGGCRARFGSR